MKRLTCIVMVVAVVISTACKRRSTEESQSLRCSKDQDCAISGAVRGTCCTDACNLRPMTVKARDAIEADNARTCAGKQLDCASDRECTKSPRPQGVALCRNFSCIQERKYVCTTDAQCVFQTKTRGECCPERCPFEGTPMHIDEAAEIDAYNDTWCKSKDRSVKRCSGPPSCPDLPAKSGVRILHCRAGICVDT